MIYARYEVAACHACLDIAMLRGHIFKGKIHQVVVILQEHSIAWWRLIGMLQIPIRRRMEPMFKKQLIIGGLVVMAILLSACGAQSAAQTSTPPLRTLNVTGSGKVLIVPDIATISIGVHTEGKDAAEAVASNNTQAQKVAQALQGMGVEEKDIRTSNFSIFPQQQFDETGKQIGTIYVVDNTVYVTVRQLDKLGELLNAVVETGANSIYGIQFDVEDKQAAVSEARKAAVENAQAQAEELAQATGVTLGEVQTINSYGGFPVPAFEGKGGGGGAVAADVPVSPGQLTLTVEVNIVYEIK